MTRSINFKYKIIVKLYPNRLSNTRIKKKKKKTNQNNCIYLKKKKPTNNLSAVFID